MITFGWGVLREGAERSELTGNGRGREGLPLQSNLPLGGQVDGHVHAAVGAGIYRAAFALQKAPIPLFAAQPQSIWHQHWRHEAVGGTRPSAA